MRECIFELCELAEGYLSITLVPKEGERTEQILPFDVKRMKEATEAELLEIADGIADALKLEKLPPITLLIRSERIYKSSLSLPMANEREATREYKKEKKRKAADGYTAKTDACEYERGYIFNTYYIPTELILPFKRIAKRFSARLAAVKPYGAYLCGMLHTSGEYVHFDIKQKVCTLIYQRNGQLISTYDFHFENTEDIKRRYLLVIAKHEFENENVRFDRYGVTADEDIELELGLRRAEPDEWTCDEEKEELHENKENDG